MTTTTVIQFVVGIVAFYGFVALALGVEYLKEQRFDAAVDQALDVANDRDADVIDFPGGAA